MQEGRSPTAVRPGVHAWRRHVVQLPGPPGAWVEIAERFVEHAAPSKPEPALALVLLCLDLAGSWERFLDGGWILLCTTHRYVYFTGRGYGDGRTLTLVEKLLRWLWQQEQLDEGEAVRLLTMVDDAREACGLARRHTLRDHVFHVGEVEQLAARFARHIPGPVDRKLATSALRVLSAVVPVGSAHLRFGALEVSELLAVALAPDSGRRERDDAGAVRTLLLILAHFYRWLASAGYLDAARAEVLVQELGRAALGIVSEARPAGRTH